MCPSRGPEPADLGELASQLDVEDLRKIVLGAADRHEDVARAVRLAGNRAASGLTALRAEIDNGLRTRRFLGYRESSEWAHEARPIVEEIRDRARSAPSAELLALIERGAAHVVKVILRADDSDGTIGELARELLDIHAEVCDAGVADPMKLAKWMIRFWFDDQDFFAVDPVRYAGALGERGLDAYRREVARRSDDGDASFALRYVRERLAVLDRDVDAIVRLLGGDLRNPYQFIRVAEAMEEIGRDDDVLAWALRGIAETQGWQVAQLYDFACRVYAKRGATGDVMALRWQQHRRMPSPTTYSLLRAATEPAAHWATYQDEARAVLASDGLVDVLLADGEPDAAWQAVLDNPGWEPGAQRWLRLVESRERAHPADALAVYLSLADGELEVTDRAAYTRAIRILKLARRAAKAADQDALFDAKVAALREQHRRRPTLIQLLDKAGLG